MKIEHIALWTDDLERLKAFYTKYFDGKAGNKYQNPATKFQSYFIEFDGGARLEIMKQPSIVPVAGHAHMAFSMGSSEAVDSLTERLSRDGYQVVSGPRTTGDGYYESCILDPDGNRVEITV